MTDDEKLVDAIATVIADAEGKNFARILEWSQEGPVGGVRETFAEMLEEWRTVARAALCAIDASGTHWVAPWEATNVIVDTARDWSGMSLGNAKSIWSTLRDACLAERKVAP